MTSGTSVLEADDEELVLPEISGPLEKADWTVFTAPGRSAAPDFCHGRATGADGVTAQLRDDDLAGCTTARASLWEGGELPG